MASVQFDKEMIAEKIQNTLDKYMEKLPEGETNNVRAVGGSKSLEGGKLCVVYLDGEVTVLSSPRGVVAERARSFAEFAAKSPAKRGPRAVTPETAVKISQSRAVTSALDKAIFAALGNNDLDTASKWAAIKKKVEKGEIEHAEVAESLNVDLDQIREGVMSRREEKGSKKAA